ncbi:MAG TPA: hypothetical protein VMH41_14925 [Mycobacteriales bacterium]|nr:hypothetical protein [Mycobacteriales bacterium]
MRRAVLHIGLPKTGSTALQGFLSGNRATLARHGLRWPESIFGPNHLVVPAAFTVRRERLTASVGVTNDRDQRRARERLRKRLDAELAHGTTVILSSEQMSTHLRSADEVRALADFMHEVADRVDVVGVLRRADYWLPSSYAEAVMGGQTRPQNGAFVQSRRHLLDHDALLDRWTTAFGPQSCHLLPFVETDKTDPMALPRRFLATVGVSASNSPGWTTPATLTRTSINARGTELLRALNPQISHAGLRPGRDRQRLFAAMATRFPGAGSTLTPSAAKALEGAGWIWTGIDQRAHDATDDWSRWAAYELAECRPAPPITHSEAAALLAELRDEGVIRRREWAGAAALRRWTLRALHR